MPDPQAARFASVADVEQWLRDHDIDTLMQGGIDIDGLWRSRHISVSDGLPPSVAHCNFVFGIDIHDVLYDPTLSYTSWDTGWPDFELKPDWSTLREVPWSPGVATVICDYEETDGQPTPLAPRRLLRSIVEECRHEGFEPKVAIELEFHILRETPASLKDRNFAEPELLTEGNHSYHPFRGLDLIHEWTRSLKDYGLPIEGILTEWGAGQFEINLRAADPITAADTTLMFKSALKELSARQGLMTTFMARLSGQGPGSSGHVHVSLWDRKRETNLFWDAEHPDHASKTMLQFASGLVSATPELTLVYLPFINSYRRVQDYLSSPTRMTVGVDNRTASFRILSHAHDLSRIENRTPGADANPYLILACTLASGLYGIRENLPPAEITRGNCYASDAPRLPDSLESAIRRFDEGKFSRKLLGDTFAEHYLATRHWELAKFRESVTDWERARYIDMV